MRKQKTIQLAALAAAVGAPAHLWAQATLTILATLDGGSTGNLVADADGNFYGATQFGGANGVGSVFEVAAGTHEVSTLATFNITNGANSQGGLIEDTAGNLYGTTYGGGANNVGTVFEVAAGTNALSTLATFDTTDGAYPEAGLVADAYGNLYGTTAVGGTANAGTVFEVAAKTNALSTVLNFGGSIGGLPRAGLIVDAGGNLYGTTESGGSDFSGNVFELAAGTHAPSLLASFNVHLGTGIDPEASLIEDAVGNLYGTCTSGTHTGYGSVFEVAAGTHALTTLGIFNGANGADPYSSLIEDTAGDLFGTTNGGGGPSDNGTVFEIAAGTDTVTTLITFDGANGYSPAGGLIADATGNLYGAAGDIVFELTNTGFVVPEPASLSLLTIVAAAGLMRRRRRLPRIDS